VSSPSENDNQPGGPYRKPRADVYTVLLIFALIALLLAIACLYYEMDLYDFKFRGGPTISANPPAALAAARPRQSFPLDRPCRPMASAVAAEEIRKPSPAAGMSDQPARLARQLHAS